MNLRDAFFVTFSFIAIFSGFLTVSRRDPMYSALSLILFFGAISGVMMILQAPFLAMMQLMVYAGAILVLFLFVIMLLALRGEEVGGERPWPLQLLAGTGCAVLFGLLSAAILRAHFSGGAPPPVPEAFGSPEEVGKSMFADFVLPFEIVSVLILAATMGAVVLAKKHLEKPDGPAGGEGDTGHVAGGGH
ncbi:MAG: NADH-quinone oxidoreductase subunit J [Planctomycetes bacterium]|nr:NADH-quinone oxidoreductase subunit J [Planctomycetota bacterium]